MEPLTPAVFHILLALADGEKHGYGIMLEVSKTTKETVIMGPGTLYGTLKRILEAGLIEETESRSDPALGKERRRYYKLTNTGRTAAQDEAARLKDLVWVAASKKLLKRPRHL